MVSASHLTGDVNVNAWLETSAHRVTEFSAIEAWWIIAAWGVVAAAVAIPRGDPPIDPGASALRSAVLSR
jgi:hypothetical protein